MKTSKDFYCIYKALRSNKSYDFQYAVKDFGFCRLCNAVTEYTGEYGIEWNYTKCLNCGKTFGDGGEAYQLYTKEISELTPEIREKLLLAYSRAQQKIYFKEALKDHIKELRSQDKSLLAARRILKTDIRNFNRMLYGKPSKPRNLKKTKK